MEVSAALKKSLDKAKIAIILDNDTTFMSTILFSMKQHWVPEGHQISTAATDGLNLYLNTKFWESLTEPQRIFLLLHESLHTAWNHMFRGRDLNAKKYNSAADYVINDELVRRSYEMPPDGLHDTQYRDMSTKAVYDMLPDPPESESGGGGIGADIIYDDPNATPEQNAAKQMEITNNIIKAVTAAKMAGDAPGSIPGEIEVYLDELLNPKLPWQVLLQDFVTGFAATEYTFKSPNRRFMPMGIVLPTLSGESLTEICVGVDTSGSVSDEEFASFLSEITDINDTMHPEKLTILDFDTSIKAEHVIEQYGDLKDVKFHGRGGTDVGPVLEWAKKNEPAVMIIFSDGQFHLTKSMDPGVPVLWVAVNAENFKPDFGQVAHFTT